MTPTNLQALARLETRYIGEAAARRTIIRWLRIRAQEVGPVHEAGYSAAVDRIEAKFIKLEQGRKAALLRLKARITHALEIEAERAAIIRLVARFDREQEQRLRAFNRLRRDFNLRTGREAW